MNSLQIQSLCIGGFRALKILKATLGSLEVIAGANGSGKSSLFEFLRTLRDAVVRGEILKEVVEGAIGRQVYHQPGGDQILWHIDLGDRASRGFSYEGFIRGPAGAAVVLSEVLARWQPGAEPGSVGMLLETVEPTTGKYALVTAVADAGASRQSYQRRSLSHLALAASHPAEFTEVLAVQDTIRGWSFYDASKVNIEAMRQFGVVEEEPTLREDQSNLASVLHYLSLEHRETFDELQVHLRGVVPGFRTMTIKGRGRGRVEVLWQEDGMKAPELALADLSDGTLRLIGWIALALSPHPPPLVCIDEPEQGVHPGALPKLAGLLTKLAQRTQVLIATHSSYFLMQFPIGCLAVMRKEDGGAVFKKPGDSAALVASLKDFGHEEIEVMHRSGELEGLP